MLMIILRKELGGGHVESSSEHKYDASGGSGILASIGKSTEEGQQKNNLTDFRTITMQIIKTITTIMIMLAIVVMTTVACKKKTNHIMHDRHRNTTSIT